MTVPGNIDTLFFGGQGYQISRSLRFNSADSTYLNRTPASAGNRTTWTWSGWVKRAAFGAAQQLFGSSIASNETTLYFTSSDTLQLYMAVSGSVVTNVITSQVFRDPAAFYHLVVSVDTTQATAADRIRLYVNGLQITAFGTSTYCAQNTQGLVNATNTHTIGRDQNTASVYFNGLLTECIFVDGQALTPSSFGETDTITGVWKPKKYAGTYPGNSFYLNFADNSGTTATTLGKDSSGNGNNWTPNNFSVTAGAGNDSLVDSPTRYGSDTGAGGEVRGNYCTLNPLFKLDSGTTTFTNGNLEWSNSSAGADGYFAGTFLISSGKFYWEATVSAVGQGVLIGVCKDTTIYSTSNEGCYRNDGTIYNLSGAAQTSGNTFTTNDVIGVAVDIAAGTVQFYKNNVAQGASPSFTFTANTSLVVRGRSNGNGAGLIFNFGQRPFAYTAPSGFKALCTTNLPEPTLVKGSSYMDVKTWTATGTDPVVISGLGFSPDLVWAKARSDSYNHVFVDQIRGVNNVLSSNLTNAEASYTTVTQFNSDGFNAGGTTNNNYSLNCAVTVARTYVAWCWDAGSSTVTNTDGTISSQVRANASAGFSVVTYTGNGTSNQTVGHGLGIAPAMIILKDRDSNTTSNNWNVWHTKLTSGHNLYLNLIDASFAVSGTTSGGLGSSPTSTTFTLQNGGSTNNNVNENGDRFVVYCFSAVAGYSAFGSYTGNGSSDGPFVFTGFRPAFVMIKRTDAANDWAMHDKSRIGYNVANYHLLANSSGIEYTDIPIDFLSSGFKLRGTSGTENTSSGTYIYAAFAENPFKYSLAR